MVELLPARKQAGTPQPRGWAAWGWGKGEGLLGTVLGPLFCFWPDCGHLSFAYFLSTLSERRGTRSHLFCVCWWRLWGSAAF